MKYPVLLITMNIAFGVIHVHTTPQKELADLAKAIEKNQYYSVFHGKSTDALRHRYHGISKSDINSTAAINTLNDLAASNEAKWIGKEASAELPDARRDKVFRALKRGAFCGVCFYAMNKMPAIFDALMPSKVSSLTDLMAASVVPGATLVVTTALPFVGIYYGYKSLKSGYRATQFEEFVTSRRGERDNATRIKTAIDDLNLD